MINHHKNSQAGFTLTELVVASFLASLLLLSLVVLERILTSTEEVLTLNSQAYNEASIAVAAMTRELRNARPAATGAYPMELANDQEIIFYANIDDDTQPEKIRYFLTGEELSRGITQPTGNPPTYTGSEEINLVIPYVQNSGTPIFVYYNGEWPSDTTNNPLPAPARLTDTKLVTVQVTINPDPARPESEYFLTSSAQIRNLKTNL